MPIVYTDTPSSDAIGRIGYDVITSELRIIFRDKERYPEYIWGGVPRDMAADFLISRSKGGFYHSQLKGKADFKIKKALGSFRLAAVGRRIKNVFKRRK